MLNIKSMHYEIFYLNVSFEHSHSAFRTSGYAGNFNEYKKKLKKLKKF